MSNRFAQQWLNILCQQVADTQAAALMALEPGTKKMRPVAKWLADGATPGDLSPICQRALATNQPASIIDALQPDETRCDFFAMPVVVGSALLGVIALKLQHSAVERQQAVFDTLQQSVQWWQLAQGQSQFSDDFYAAVVNLLAGCMEQNSYPEVLIRLATELAQTLDCERVAIGEFHDNYTKVVAISHNAQLDPQTNLLQKIADAMDEAIEQDSIVVVPNTVSAIIQRAHLEVARKYGYGSLLTLPMLHCGEFIGAVTLLRSEQRPFDSRSVRLCEQALALIAPYMALKKIDEQALTTKMGVSLKQGLKEFFGLKGLALKLTGVGLLVFLLLASILRGDFRVTADAVLEGKIQRVVAAPISGFLQSAAVRAGDTVRQGEVMASLDDAELQLELNKLDGQLQKFRREYREALSSGDLVKVRVISAQIDQADAEMELTRQQLQKIVLTAPFDGVVIEGDLSQKLGSPVDRGSTLFKIAPLEGYRIILKVDESAISYVREGQKGSLVLASMPSQTFSLVVQKITAVAKTDSGRNIFRVEASLENAPELLRPGMEGVGKIETGRASWLWIWSHEMLAWLRLWIWSW
ncbi:HlyD family efflux transporter periplasmic adaptor subunit [Methylomonas sp. HW2-6]|uniref:HlyD family efflux transporter periplasmic adaptor subunit n=1 Tax=Methylomonas sp. HW2-6 TaxID=3376687 RepID=UPI004041FA51